MISFVATLVLCSIWLLLLSSRARLCSFSTFLWKNLAFLTLSRNTFLRIHGKLHCFVCLFAWKSIHIQETFVQLSCPRKGTEKRLFSSHVDHQMFGEKRRHS